MNRKVLAFILLLLCVTVLPILAGAETKGYCNDDGTLKWTLSDTGTLTISGSGEMKYVGWDIPSVKKLTIKGATNICDGAFYNCSNLASVTIGTSVTSIGGGAFYQCSKIETINIPDSVTSIGEWAFGYCEGLKKITIPNSVKSIGQYCFFNCTNLASATIGTSVTGIGEWAFGYCEGLKIITIPNSVKSMGEKVFFHCTSLTSAAIGTGLKSIPNETFNYCDALKDITIPANVTQFGQDAIPVSTTWHVEKDSAAYKYALNHGIRFLLPGEEETPSTAKTVSQRVEEIVNEVIKPGMSDYQKALALHNYLINHANYDYTYKNHDADGVLLLGTGVCESYANAYALLLDKVGISNWKETGYDHIWNVAKLGSVWCHIDVTWDDPNEGGFENQTFFGLTDFALEGVEHHEREKRETACTNYKASYAYKNGILTSIVNDWKDQINARIDASKYSFYLTGQFSANDKGVNIRMAYQMLQDQTFTVNGSELKPTLSYSNSMTDLTYKIKVKFAVASKPVITTQPSSKKVNEEATATFKVVATNADSYQWYYRTSSSGTWAALKNGTSASYSLTTKAKHNGYQFFCRVTNAVGYVNSDIVTLTVKPKPVITTQPSNRKVNEGAKATFKVAATQAASYQWYYRTSSKGSWTEVKNGTSATYSLTTKAKHNGYQFFCRVTNAAGYTDSEIVTLTVKPKPVITTQPSSKKVNESAKAAFKVAATYAVSYQWYYRTSSKGSWTEVSKNGTSDTYSLTTKAKHNGYQFFCRVTNAAGYVDSEIVTLTVE